MKKNRLSKEQIIAMLAGGKTLAEVAEQAGISRQRVGAIAGKLNRRPGRRVANPV